MKKVMEKASVLGLSMMLTTAYSMSSALPAMIGFYRHHTASQVEWLVAIPSFGIMILLLFDHLVERFLSERKRLVIGLLLLSSCGIIPFFYQGYFIVLSSRFVFGLGIGLINAKAISMISERFSGRERMQMLGYRSSAEVIGTAFLTMLVGQLLQFGWTSTFLIYTFGFLVLFFYLRYVPYSPEKIEAIPVETKQVKLQFTAKQRRESICFALIAGGIVCSNIVMNFRIPQLILSFSGGTEESASLILGLMQLTGVLAGVSFASLEGIFKERLLVLSGLIFGISHILLGWSQATWLVGISALLAGFSYSISLTMIFTFLSEKIPLSLLSQVTSLVVLGCSGGATLTPVLLSLLGLISKEPVFIFTSVGLGMVVLSLLSGLLVKSNHKVGEE